MHFTDDDTCTRCGRTESDSAFADVDVILRFFPYIPLKDIPQETKKGILFDGNPVVYPVNEQGVCSEVEDAFFIIRALIRENHYAVRKRTAKP